MTRSTNTHSTDPVLILGGGINGAALARELLLSHVPVVLVDVADICSGTTAYSSRLIHGGLRYLEFGEFDIKPSNRSVARFIGTPAKPNISVIYPVFTLKLLLRGSKTDAPGCEPA